MAARRSAQNRASPYQYFVCQCDALLPTKQSSRELPPLDQNITKQHSAFCFGNGLKGSFATTKPAQSLVVRPTQALRQAICTFAKRRHHCCARPSPEDLGSIAQVQTNRPTRPGRSDPLIFGEYRPAWLTRNELGRLERPEIPSFFGP